MALILVLFSLLVILIAGADYLTLGLLICSVAYFYFAQKRRSKQDPPKESNPWQTNQNQRQASPQKPIESQRSTSQNMSIFRYHKESEKRILQQLSDGDFERAQVEAITIIFFANLAKFEVINEDKLDKLIAPTSINTKGLAFDTKAVYEKAKAKPISATSFSEMVPKHLYQLPRKFDQVFNYLQKVVRKTGGQRRGFNRELVEFSRALSRHNYRLELIALVYLIDPVTKEFPQVLKEILPREQIDINKSSSKRLVQLAQLLFNRPEEALNELSSMLANRNFRKALVSSTISAAYHWGKYEERERTYMHNLAARLGISDYEFKSIEDRELCHDFLNALIALSAKLSKVDGKVTRDELKIIRDVLLKEEYEPEKVSTIFKEARDSRQSFEIFAFQIKEKLRNNQRRLEAILESLYFIATSDSNFSPKENQFIARVAEIFGISQSNHEHITFKFVPQDFSTTKLDPYKILGVNASDTDQQIKKAFRQLQKQYHPDVAISRDMPKGYLEVCNRKIATINKAYKEIKQLRKAEI